MVWSLKQLPYLLHCHVCSVFNDITKQYQVFLGLSFSSSFQMEIVKLKPSNSLG